MKNETRGGVEYRYSAEWTRKLESKKHWEYYWHQQKLMEGLVVPGRDDMLEIGVGSGFAANYMRSKGFSITTLDIDAEKRPDIVANVVSYEFSRRFAAVMAFEILEHIPFSEFERLVARIPSFTDGYAFVSLPRNMVSLFSIGIKLPKLREFRFGVGVRRRKICTPSHHWEMDFGPYGMSRVEAIIESNGMSIVRRMASGNIMFYALKIGASRRSGA